MSSLQQFETPEEFKTECLQDSAIDPLFWGTAIDLIEEQVINPDTHEVDALPIHDALHWDYPRFVRKIDKPLLAGAFHQADGTVWQLKLSRARWDKKKKEPRKYECPKGCGSPAYLPAVPEAIQRRILDRYGLALPTVAPEKWWDLVAEHPEIPLVITEGGKKALAGLSHGYATIALIGIHGGHHRVDKTDSLNRNITLNSDLRRWMVPGRKVFMAFDQDIKQKTRNKVEYALLQLGGLLTVQGCEVKVATWDPENGKGLDDLICNLFPFEVDREIERAKPLLQWKRDCQIERKRRYHSGALGKFRWQNAGYVELNIPDLMGEDEMFMEDIPEKGTLVLKSRTGTGKTNLIKWLIEEVLNVIAPGHRESLQRGLAIRLGMDYLNDLERVQSVGLMNTAGDDYARRISMCMDSVFKIPLHSLEPGKFVLVLDEADQALFHALLGGTCGKEGRRPLVQKRLVWLIKNAKQVILSSANVTEKEIAMVSEIRDNELPYIVDNKYQGSGYPVDFYTDGPLKTKTRSLARSEVQRQLIAAIKQGKRCIVHTDTKGERGSRMIATLGMMLGLKDEQILRFDGETSCEPWQREFADSPNEFLEREDIRLLVASPSLTSGVSVEGDFFDLVFGFFEGQTILPSDAMQSLARYRRKVPRIVFASARGKGKLLEPLNALDYTGKMKSKAEFIMRVLDEEDLNLDINTPTARYVAVRQAFDHWAKVQFGVSLQAELENEGHQVTIAKLPEPATVEATKAPIKQAREQMREDKIDEKVTPPVSGGEIHSHREKLRKNKERACQFYGIAPEDWNREMVNMDNDGKYRRGVRELASYFVAGNARNRDMWKLDALKKHDAPIALHDLPGDEARRQLVVGSGMWDALVHAIKLSEQGEGWSKESEWIPELMEKLEPYQGDIKLLLGVKLSFKISPCSWWGKLVEHLTKGVLKTKSRKVGPRGHQVTVHVFTAESMEKALKYLDNHLKSSDMPGVGKPMLIPKTEDPVSTTRILSLFIRVVDTEFVNMEIGPDGSWIRATEHPPLIPIAV